MTTASSVPTPSEQAHTHSPEMGTGILLIGPSTVGKTELGFALAEDLGGQLVNADRFYLYSGFPCTTGLPEFHIHPTVSTHLYEVLAPESDPLNESEFGARAASVVQQILARGSVPIVEGCYYRYARALLAATPTTSWVVAGIRWESDTEVPHRVEARVKDIFYKRRGIEEVKAALERGYRNSYVMRNGSMVRPLVEYLDGNISLETAEDKAIVEILSSAYRSLRRFLDFQDITWYTHDRLHMASVASRIKSRLGR